jgi:hypothetical protein
VSLVRGNRPWLFVYDLSKLLVLALSTAAYAVITSSVWLLSDSLEWPRLVLCSLVSVGALTAWLIIGAELWAKRSDESDREQVWLVNAATLLTLLIGVSTLYVALFLITLLAAAVVIDGGAFGTTVAHEVDFGDYAALAWLAASIATIVGALGSGLESDDDVREAVYGYRPNPRASEDPAAAS